MFLLRKKYIFTSGVLLVLVLAGGLYTNTSISQCDRSPLCIAMYKVIKNDNSLSLEQTMDHVSNRLGYGVNSFDLTLTSATANDTKLKNILVPIAQTIEKPSDRGFLNRELIELGKAFVYKTPNSGISFNPILNSPQQIRSYYKQIDNVVTEHELRSRDKSFMRHRTVEAVERFRILTEAFRSQEKIDSADNKYLHDKQSNLGGILQDFWFNHFNVDYTKINLDSALGLSDINSRSYEEVIYNKMVGPSATFADLLEGVQTHSAMIYYLDNQSNRYTIGVDKKIFASNQNLGRELIELHTLGVGPGRFYNQSDVEGSSLMLTGLNIYSKNKKADDPGSFVHEVVRNYLLHAPDYASIGPKGERIQTSPVVMGKRFCLNQGVVLNSDGKCRDMQPIVDPLEGSQRVANIQSQFYKMLASHERTKINICSKLVNRFIRTRYLPSGFEDDPNTLKNESIYEVQRASVVKRCINAWGKYGDLNRMYTSILTSPEMWSQHNYSGTSKNPFELVISAVRSTGLTLAHLNSEQQIRLADTMIKQVRGMGIPYRSWPAPTGYRLDGNHWIGQRYFIQWLNANFRLVNFMEGLKLYTPIMKIQQTSSPSNANLVGSEEERVIGASSDLQRYERIRYLMGNPGVRENNSKIKKDLVSIISNKTCDSRIGSKIYATPLKTGLLLETTSFAFMRK